MFDAIKNEVVKFVVGWLATISGGVLAYLSQIGVAVDLEKLIGGIIAILIGLIFHAQAASNLLKTPPPSGAGK